MSRFLLVSHSASQSGAPIALLQLAQRIISRGHQVEFLCGSGGAILDEFRAIGPVTVLGAIYSSKGSGSRLQRLKNSVKDFRNRRLVQGLLKRFQPDVCYINTLACWHAGQYLRGRRVPKVVHVHELGWVIDHFCGRQNAERLMDLAGSVVACSQEVADNLSASFDLSSKPFCVVRAFVDVEKLDRGHRASPSDSFRKKLGIGETDFVVGSLGAADWRKGIDLFVPLAKSLVAQIPNARFVWMGYFESQTLLPSLLKDIREANLEKHVFLENPRKDVESFLASMDVYASLGREDPYPLSVLEAGYFGKPVVCFDGSGGIPEFARRGAGMVVPYLCLDDFRDALLKLYRDRDASSRIGAQARALVLEHHQMDSACDRIIDFVVGQHISSQPIR